MYVTNASAFHVYRPSLLSIEGLRQTEGYLSAFLAFFGFGFLATCGAGGVFSIRRSTSSGEGVGRLVMVLRVCHG
jgi:hypothetical protein